MPDNIVACNLGSYGKYREGALEHLAGIGVRHVEVPAPPPEELDAVRAKLERLGLTATSVLGRCDITDDGGAEALESTVAAAHALGATVIFTSVKAGPVPRADVWRRLRAMGDVAGSRGITLALETHPDLAHNGEVARETMQAVDHPNVRINYDTGNVYFYNEGIDGLDELRKIEEYVAAVHLKDTNGGYQDWHFPALGEGVCDFRGIFRMMNQRGFRGPFTMELEGIRGENADEARVRGRVEQSVAHLREIGVIV